MDAFYTFTLDHVSTGKEHKQTLFYNSINFTEGQKIKLFYIIVV